MLIHTEFRRRVAENGSSGTDHNTGGLVYIMGEGINGGLVITDWPGHANADLEMGEDLKINIDLRTVLAQMLNKRMVGTDISDVFPGFTGLFGAGDSTS